MRRWHRSMHRYCPEARLPESAYVPGKSPLANRPELGDFAVSPTVLASLGFRFGVDLFHAGYYWEAHEVWESLWKKLPQEDDWRLVLQALIQAAASLLKKSIGQSAGAASLREKCTQKISVLMSAGRCPEFLRLLGEDLEAERTPAIRLNP